MLEIIPVKALRDNYIWLIKHKSSSQVLVVDPGDAQPAVDFIKKHRLTLNSILITHHHWDHTNGIDQLLSYQQAPVYAPAKEIVSQCSHPLSDADRVAWPKLNIEFQVLDIPGHTAGHIAYVGHNSVFCGDTLFAAGCGRLFEGAPHELYTSLKRLAELPDETNVFCAHEYTEANLKFALTVEPDNRATQERLKFVQKKRANSQVTLPSTIQLEKRTNPFLRCHLASVQLAVMKQCGQSSTDPLAVFTALRNWKDQF